MASRKMVDIEDHGQYRILFLNNPPVNALSEDMVSELTEIFSHISTGGVNAVILCGRDKIFSAGLNLRELRNNNAEENEALFDKIYSLLELVQNTPVPVIAAVNGDAIGGGFELALCADIRILDPQARLGTTGVNLGLVFCTQRLSRLSGIGTAKEMLFSARLISAPEAKERRIAQLVSSPGQALKEAIELARLIATKSPSAVRAVKQAINSGYDLPLEEGLKVEKGELFRVLMTNEYKGRIQ
jgi:enoyl-CoA hydratase